MRFRVGADSNEDKETLVRNCYMRLADMRFGKVDGAGFGETGIPFG
jgi:hypothetical protein